MKYWPFLDPFYLSLSSTSGPVDQAATFTPDVGPTITRRRTTARVDMWSGSVILYDFAQLAEFETWFQNDLQGGVLPFVWRRSDSDQVARFKFAPATYSKAFLGNERVRLSFDVMVLPGSLWFAPYVIPKTAKPPAWVADYAASVFGVNGVKGVVGDLAAVSGTFDVLVTFTDGGVQFQRLTFAADIPSTAPSGVASYVAFA